MRAIACLFLMILAVAARADEDPLRVGSKRFTESYILGEIVTQAARAAGAPAEHKPGLGNTAILVAALENGAIDVYPEYTGTIAREILGVQQELDAGGARRAPRAARAGGLGAPRLLRQLRHRRARCLCARARPREAL